MLLIRSMSTELLLSTVNVLINELSRTKGIENDNQNPNGSGPFVSYVGFVQNAGTTSSLAIMEAFLAIIFGRQDRNRPSRFLQIFACRGGPGSAAQRARAPAARKN